MEDKIMSKVKNLARISAVGVLGTALIGLGAGTASAAPVAKVSDIKVGVIAINSVGALQYAIDSGIMKKNGLNVTETIVFPAPPPGIAGLASGAVNFTYAPTIPAINAYENAGIALRIVAPADGYSTADLSAAKKDGVFAAKIDDTGVCVAANSPITSWKGLEGQTVSVPARGAQAEVTITSAVKAAGGNPSLIKWATLGPAQVITSLKSGAIAAGFVVEPFTSLCTNSGLRNIGQPGIQFFTVEKAIGVWLTTQDYANKYPKQVAAFQKSIYEANSFAMKSAANMRTVTIASTKITKVPVKTALAANPTYYPLSVTKFDVATPAQKMFDLGFLRKKANVAGMLMRQYTPLKGTSTKN
jgi:NitT/TauT family transport system substrate-binding protein